MRRILFQQTDFNSLPNPPAGFNYIGFDGPNFSEKSEDGKINQSVGATGPTGPAGTGGSASSDRLISSNETHNMELVLDNKGTLNIPLMLPVSFTATCDDTHYDGTASFTTSDWWEFEVEFQVSTYGSVAVMMNDIFPILTNPGYVSGYTFRFTEEDHGIPNYNFDIQLNDVQSGTAGWTALLAVSQSPEYPSTIESLGAIKITSNDNSLVLGTDGVLYIPNGIDFPLSNGNNRTGEGNNLQFEKGSAFQKIISTQDGTELVPTVERLVISGGDSYNDLGNYEGEGGDIYLWAGKGANGGDIKVDAGESTEGDGGSVKIRGGYSEYNGGFVEITSGYGASGSGGNININSEYGSVNGGNISLQAGNGGNNGGNISLSTSAGSWTFKPNGALVFPDSTEQTTAFQGVTDITYSSILDAIDQGELIPGSYYRITDFRTCYDQPDYDYSGSAIEIGNYKQASVYPIIVFALSSDSLASDAYQPEYPNDNIKYDVSFSETEVTGGTAYGRITYRKDENGNAFDYDFREVLFKRYDTYFSEEVYDGTVSVDFSILGVNFADVTGVGTNFGNFATGSVIGVLNINNSPIVSYYEVVSIEDDTNMVVTGNVITTVNNTRLLDANLLTGRSWKQNNIISRTASYEYPTFGDIERCFSNTTTNTTAYTVWEEETFLLPNNVFSGNVTYKDNSFGHDFRNNTFNTSCDSNRIGGSFYNNIIDNDFDNNIINDNFYDNIIDCDFQRNTIMGEFYNNHFGDDDGEDFDYNIIQSSFNNNFYTGDDNFEYNLIKGNFNNNIILGEFSKNTLNGYYENVSEDTFSDNQVGEGFHGNKTYREFRDNVIGDEVYDNNFFGTFYGNTLIGDESYENDIYSDFEDNQIGGNFQYNNIGDSGDIDNTYFGNNKIGNNFNNNTIRRDFEDNQIGNYFENNNLYGDFRNNVIGNDFSNNNNIGYRFNSNHIGNNFNSNDYIGDYFQNNKIGDYFENNYYIYNNFKDNSIGNEFKNNTLGDIQYFNWDDISIENLTTRNYDTFYDALYGDGGGNIGNVILGKELIMHFILPSGSTITDGELIVGETYEITNYQGTDDFTDVADIQSGVINTNGCVFIATGPTVSNWSSNSVLTELTSYDEYHLVKFTQWTQNNNGGGFSYERTRIWANGNTISEPTVYFTKENYQSEAVDVIIEGRLEITRGDNKAIYNSAVENQWSNNTPFGTEWNSIYTQGEIYFSDNEISNQFKGNHILNDFGSNKIMSAFGDDQFSSNIISGPFYENIIGDVFVDNDVNSFYSNKLGSFFVDNNIGDDFADNNIGDEFYNNDISSDFRDNNIGDDFYNNSIAPDFRNNTIGKYFRNNTIGESFGFGNSESQNNIIDDFFQDNIIGEYFYNNKVASYFENNNVGYYFQRNNIDTEIYGEDFIVNYGNIISFTYSSSGTTSNDSYYVVSGNTNEHGDNSTFGVTVSGGTISSVILLSAGNQYEISDTITIPGNIIGGQTGVIFNFSNDGIGKNGADGTYSIYAGGTGSGENAIFDVIVTGSLVTGVQLNNGGGGYQIGDPLTISGGQFGGTNSVDDFIIIVNYLYSDDITITIAEVSERPSVYESYNCQIFERKGGNKRLSFYDDNDILTIKNINE